MIYEIDVSFSKSKKKKGSLMEVTNLKVGHFENPKIVAPGGEKNYILCVGATFTNNMRSDANLIEYTMLSLDIDSGDWGDLERAEELLKKANIEYIYHTTFSHTPENPRYRIFIPFDKPLTPVQYAPVARRIVNILKIPADNCSYSNSQGMFMPMVPKENIDHYRWFHNEAGVPLDTGKHVEAIPVEEFVKEDSLLIDTWDPLVIPNGINESIWMAAICHAYPAQDCATYDEWRDMGMAIYHQTNGTGLDYWMKWSRQSDIHGEKISEHEMATSKWKSFKANGKKKGITMRTILNKNPTVLGKAYAYAMAEGIEDNTSMDKFITHIQEDRFIKPQSKNIIATALRATHSKLNDGEKISKGDALERITPVATEEEREWAEDWYYCHADKQMYDITRPLHPWSVDSFNAEFTRKMPMSPTGSRTKAFDCFMKAMWGYELQTVDFPKFAPGEDQVFEKNGTSYINLFNHLPLPTSVPFGENEIDSKIEDYIDKHLTALCGDRDEVKLYVKQHIGHLRQNPGKRIHIGLAITSTLTGIGKSTLKKVYGTVLGSNHIDMASNTELTDKFNAWVANPKMVTFFEEINLRGKQLFEAMEKLKEIITEDRVSVRLMNQAAKAYPISTCIVIFSNYPAVLGHQGFGRRWSAIRCPWRSLDELEEEALGGMDKEEFFAEYRDLLDKHPDRFAAYFDSIDLTTFNTDRPLMSSEKDAYEEDNRDVRTSRAIQRLIDEGIHPLINNEFIVWSHLIKALNNSVAFDGEGDEDIIPFMESRTTGRRLLMHEALAAAEFYPAKKPGEPNARTPRIGPENKQYWYSAIWIRHDDWKFALGRDNNVIPLTAEDI